ncbi:MAG: Hsp20/alpha crystallin family protein [Erysipelotrichaceae bacterium]|nr:Hsp20/alpha crystallin family protein [Erysipelotrichaceae bacterium]
MLLPRLFDDDLFDDFFEMDRRPVFGKHEKMWMKTDVKEKDGSYELDMDLPGFKKEEVQIELNQGYLTITASKNHDVNEEKEEGNYIRKERYYGSCSRSFYVGENIHHEDIKASFSDGILHLNIPKLNENNIENKKYILIE